MYVVSVVSESQAWFGMCWKRGSQSYSWLGCCLTSAMYGQEHSRIRLHDRVQVEDSSVEVFRNLVFLTVDEFRQIFKVTPREAKVQVDSLFNEHGDPCEGVLMSEEAGDCLGPKFKRVRVAHRVGCEFAEPIARTWTATST